MCEPIKDGCCSEQSDTNIETSCDKPVPNPRITAQSALITHQLNVWLLLQITYIDIFPPDRETRQDGCRFLSVFSVRLLSVSRPESEAAAAAAVARNRVSTRDRVSFRTQAIAVWNAWSKLGIATVACYIQSRCIKPNYLYKI